MNRINDYYGSFTDEEGKLGYRVSITAIIDEEENYRFKAFSFDTYEAAYQLYNYITLDGVKDALNSPIRPRVAYISLNAVDADGFIIESKNNKHRLLKRI